MFTKVLIGVDGGSGGRDALALARELAAPEAGLVLGHIWPAGAGVTAMITGSPHPSATAVELLQGELLAAGLACATAVRSSSSTHAGLHELAEELGCDLLVIGPSAGQPTGQVFLTGPARTALHGAPCAVAVAPRGYAAAGRPIMSVGVGYQETALGNATLSRARGLAAQIGSTLQVTLVVPPLPSAWESPPVAYLAELEDLVVDQANAAKARLATLEGCVTHVCRGEPVMRLRQVSANVDLLVLGSRGYGPVRRVLFGSTSDALVQEARCAVLVLIRPELEAVDRGQADAAVLAGV